MLIKEHLKKTLKSFIQHLQMDKVAGCPINGALKLFTLLKLVSVRTNIKKRDMAMLINFTIHHDHLSKKLR